MKKVLTILVILILVLTSCSLVDRVGGWLVGSATYNLPISYNLSAISRTLESEYDITVSSVTATVENELFSYGPVALSFNQSTDVASGIINNIVEGTYTVTLKAYTLNSSNESFLVAEGSKSGVSIVGGGITSVDIPMAIVVGLGGLSINGNLISSNIPVWSKTRRDLIGSSFYEFGSVFETSTELIKTEFDSSIYIGQILVGDVDGGKDIDIIHAQGNIIKVYSPDGTLKRNITIGHPNGYVTLLEDVNEDGLLDIGIGTHSAPYEAYFYTGQGELIQTFTNTHGATGDGQIRPIGVQNGKVFMYVDSGYPKIPRGFSCFDLSTAEELWYYQLGPIGCDTWSIHDIDNDDLWEFVRGSGTVHNGASGNNTTDGDEYLVIVNENGDNDLTIMHDSPSNGRVDHLFTDLNSDDQYEILAFRSYDTSYHGITKIQKFDISGNLLDEFSSGISDKEWTYSIVDIDDDSLLEIVASCVDLLLILNHNLEIITQKSISGDIQCTADLTGDGEIEIVIRQNDGSLVVLDENLNIIDTIVVGIDGRGSVIATDIDKDGVVELICASDKLSIIEFAL